jgi:hypothetical protein
MLTDYSIGADITEQGRLKLDDQEQFRRAMRAFKRGRVTVHIEVEGARRSIQQNRYYRHVLSLISEHTGDDPEYLHEHFKRAFIEPKEIEVFGNKLTIWTTTEENREDFWEFVEKIRRFVLTELDISTPDPDPALRRRARRSSRRAA